jgi:DNA-binding NtrC family response regulator
MAAELTARPGGDGDRTVLVVEGDRSTRELLGTILGNEGISCRLTSNGHAAMQAVRQQAPAMVILDMHLPTLQGEAVGTALRIEYGAKLPILAMSASAEEAAAERIGAYAFIGKPFELEDVVRLVRRGLELSEESYALLRRSHEGRMRLAGAIDQQRAAFQRALERRRHAKTDAGAARS